MKISNNVKTALAVIAGLVVGIAAVAAIWFVRLKIISIIAGMIK